MYFFCQRDQRIGLIGLLLELHADIIRKDWENYNKHSLISLRFTERFNNPFVNAYIFCQTFIKACHDRFEGFRVVVNQERTSDSFLLRQYGVAW